MTLLPNLHYKMPMYELDPFMRRFIGDFTWSCARDAVKSLLGSDLTGWQKRKIAKSAMITAGCTATDDLIYFAIEAAYVWFIHPNGDHRHHDHADTIKP